MIRDDDLDPSLAYAFQQLKNLLLQHKVKMVSLLVQQHLHNVMLLLVSKIVVLKSRRIHANFFYVGINLFLFRFYSNPRKAVIAENSRREEDKHHSDGDSKVAKVRRSAGV